MKTIWKYKLGFRPVQTIATPLEFEPLHVDTQRGEICVWAKVEPDIGLNNQMMPHRVERTVFLVATGEELNFSLDKYKYAGTIQAASLVFHVFIETTPCTQS